MLKVCGVGGFLKKNPLKLFFWVKQPFKFVHDGNSNLSFADKNVYYIFVLKLFGIPNLSNTQWIFSKIAL